MQNHCEDTFCEIRADRFARDHVFVLVRLHVRALRREPSSEHTHTPTHPHTYTPTHPHTHTPTHPHTHTHTHTHTPPPCPLPSEEGTSWEVFRTLPVKQGQNLALPVLCVPYRGTSLRRNTPPVEPYSSPMPGDLW